jgi:CRISPR/Cas system-associated protein Cas10 (large subunit of type III CRISPR-Cas system)
VNRLRFAAIILFLVSILFIAKALDLYNRFYNEVRDGDGIGLYFYGFEINDKLLYEQIPFYLWSFLAIGILLIIFSVILFIRAKRRKEY